MKLLDDLKAIDECLSRVEMMEHEGFYFLHLYGVHHPHLLGKKLKELGYRYISYHPCECFDRSKLRPKMKSKGAQDQRFLHLKNHKRGEPRVPSHPGPKKGYYK